MPSPHPYKYVRGTYRVPAEVNGLVQVVHGYRFGLITKGKHDQYVHVLFAEGKFAVPCHPTDLLYLDSHGKPLPNLTPEEAGSPF